MRENIHIECMLNWIYIIHKLMCNVFFVLHQVLAARVSTAGKSLSQLRGTIVVNGQRRVESKFRKISAYVFMYSKDIERHE